MALEFKDIKEAALKLPASEKRELLKALIADQGFVDPANWETEVQSLIVKYRPALEELAK